MAFVTRHRLIPTLAISGLIAANLLIDIALIWAGEEWSPGSQWVHETTIAMLLSQLTLLALWFGLGDGRWYVRVAIVVPLTLCIANTIDIGMRLAAHASSNNAPDASSMVFFIFLAMLLAISCFGFALRRMLSWRWSWEPVANNPARGQFQINDVLLVMIVLGGSLAAVRFLVTIDSNFPSQILDISLYAVKTTAVALGAMLLAYSKRHRVRGAVLLMLAVLVTGVLFAMPDAYKSVPRLQIGVGTTSAPVWTYAVAWWKENLKQEAFAVGAAICALANCLVLRLLGGKLVRPGGPRLESARLTPDQPYGYASDTGPGASLQKERAMWSTRSVGCLMCIVLATANALADEPAAEKKVPFWELPKTNVDLRSLAPADVKLVSIPDLKGGLIVLQTGDVAPPIDFVPESAELKALVAEKDSGYQVIPKRLMIGAAPFGDRKYKIDKLPQAFSGLTLLQTKMGHKAIADANYSITVSAAKPCLVFLALDQRVMDTYSQHGTPGWLQEYAPTGESIRTDEPIMAQTSSEFLVFVRKSAGGRIVFGPPAMDTQFNAMYFAFFGESKAE